jgi:hypothetical protein
VDVPTPLLKGCEFSATQGDVHGKSARAKSRGSLISFLKTVLDTRCASDDSHVAARPSLL